MTPIRAFLYNMDRRKIIGIYKITSNAKRVYIGQSIDIKRRFNDYMMLRCKTQPRLYNSFKKHGVYNHKFEVIEECSIEQLNDRERYWQDFYDVLGENGLNLKLTETNEMKGYFSKIHRENISKSISGCKHPMWGKKGELSIHYGKKKTKEHIEKMKLINKGRKFSDEVNSKKGLKGKLNPFYRKSHPDELIRWYKTSQSNKVKVLENGKEIIFECVGDCADYFNCTTKNILFRDKQRLKGIESKFGIFKRVYLEIIKKYEAA